MAQVPLLLTSFQPWRAHQHSNSSDDLLLALHQQGRLPASSRWLRNVPVSFELAPIRVISEVYYWRPRVVICCGMAENRAHLSLEQLAVKKSDTLSTDIDLQPLLQRTQLSEVSYDAGRYVCNHLYYHVLQAAK